MGAANGALPDLSGLPPPKSGSRHADADTDTIMLRISGVAYGARIPRSFPS